MIFRHTCQILHVTVIIRCVLLERISVELWILMYTSINSIYTENTRTITRRKKYEKRSIN